MTVRELLHRMDSVELMEWRAYYRIMAEDAERAGLDRLAAEKNEIARARGPRRRAGSGHPAITHRR